jgi:xanthine dehydrogenase FAD-binding subunit
VKISEIHVPESIPALLSLLAGNPEMTLIAGATELLGNQKSRVLDLPDEIASISKIQDLRRTQRTEQFLEVGSCTTLTGLLSLSTGTLPPPLHSVISSIGNHAIRNVATIGGNLCSRRRFLDLWPFLSCMDAQIEIRSAFGTKWASVSHLCSESGQPDFPKASLLSRIRIPIYTHNFIYFKKFGAPGYPGITNAVFICLASISHQKIDSFKLAFSGQKAFRLKDMEMSFTGRRIPTKKEAAVFIASYKDAFEKEDWFSTQIFCNVLDECFDRMFE